MCPSILVEDKSVLARLASAVVAAVLTVSCALVVPSRAAAEDPPGGRIELVSQTDWVSGGAPFDFEVAVTGRPPVDETEIVTTVHQALPNRSQFQRTLEDSGLGSSVILERRPLGEALGPDNVIRSSLPVQDPTQRRYFLRNPGVYPVKVELRSARESDPLDTFITYLINVTSVPPRESRMLVSPVLPVRATDTPAVRDTDVRDTEERSTGSAGALASVLARNPDSRLTLAPSAESLERLDRTEEGGAALAGIEAARNGRAVLSSSYVPLPGVFFPSPSSETPLDSERREQFDRGSSVIARHFSNPEATTGLITSQIGTDGAAFYSQRGTRRLLVAENTLTPARRDTTLARPFSVSTGRGSDPLPAVQLDLGLERHLAEVTEPVLSAHRVLADLAVIYNDSPGLARGVAFTAPDGRDIDSDLLDVVLRSIENSPIVASSDLDRLFELPVDGGGRLGTTRTMAATSREENREFPVEKVNEVRRKINGFASMTADDDASLDDLERRLLINQSSTLSSEARREAIEETESTLQRILDAIRLPDERSIRFTARQGEVPVSIQNDSGSKIRVVVRLNSDKVDFVDGGTRTIEIERQQVTERFDVDVQTSGVFPLQLRLESPDGTISIARSQVIVRSTATSGVGVVLSIGAGGFLAIWWLRSALRSRKLAR